MTLMDTVRKFLSPGAQKQRTQAGQSRDHIVDRSAGRLQAAIDCNTEQNDIFVRTVCDLRRYYEARR